MMAIRPGRSWVKRGAIALGLGALTASPVLAPAGDYLSRLGIDFLLPVRHAIFGPIFSPEHSRAVLVVIDEETYRTPPFSETPRVAWTPMVAKVLDKVTAAGPAVIGMDLVYPTTLDTRDLVPGIDKPLLRSFYRAGRAGKLVLGEIRLSGETIRPYQGQIIAAGGPQNVRPLNILSDTDEVVRRYPANFRDEKGGSVPSFASELSARAGTTPPRADFLINFNTGADDIPAFSLADLHRCADPDFFARAFRDRVVIFGATLDVEDRAVPAKRFAKGSEPDHRPLRCALPFNSARFGQIVERRSMPGIFIHAAAVNTLMRQEPLELLGRRQSFALLAAGGFALALAFFLVSPLAGFALVLSALGLHGGVATLLFAEGLVMPLLPAAAGMLLSYTVIYAYRVVVEDRQKRQIKKAFGHYLDPTLVDRLAEDSASLELGGELRRVTVMFTDIADYTTLSETMSERPDRLVTILNRYFSVLVEVVQAHGGYVVAYVGDAVMAVWGAPLADPRAEARAVEAALECLEKLETFNRDIVGKEFGLPAIETRFGINTGIALVGNTGSATRMNYTVTGDTTNLAARLEGANKVYGTRLMIGEETARGLGRAFALRRLDRLVVKGRTRPVKVYEVLGRMETVSGAARSGVRAFHAAMADYYRRRFAAAREAFSKLSADDNVAAVFADRCRKFEENPPPSDWDRSFELDAK